MKQIQPEEIVMDFIDGTLDYESFKAAMIKAGENEAAINEAVALKNMCTRLDEIPVPEPSENLDKKFYNMLEPASIIAEQNNETVKSFAAKIKEKFSVVTLPKIGYAVGLVIAGLAVGRLFMPSDKTQLNQMSDEVKQMKEVMMYSLLNQPAASERIKGVSYVNSLPDVDSKVADALLQTLNNDPDVNVRLETVDALSKFTANPVVRQGLVQSITKQKSPLVQAALAELMVSIKEKNSIEPLKKLLEDKQLNYKVKTKIENCIAKL